MTAPMPGTVNGFLLRAGLLTAVLAVIAGIFGMHIMTGAHAMPASPGAAPAHTQTLAGHSSDAAAPASLSGSATPDVSAVPVAKPGAATSTCGETRGCPSMSAMDAPCALSPANTSLTAPLPATTPFRAPDSAGAVVTSTGYSYLPESPSPGDLCISRT